MAFLHRVVMVVCRVADLCLSLTKYLISPIATLIWPVEILLRVVFQVGLVHLDSVFVVPVIVNGLPIHYWS